MTRPFPPDLVYQHVVAISTEIGPRLATSVMERSAAYYVESRLRECGFEPRRQTFTTIERFSKRLMPQMVLSATALGVGLLTKGVSRWLAGLVSLGMAWHYRRIFLGYKPLWENIFAELDSQNVILKIPPKGETQNQVVLVAHLDTGFNRLSFHPTLTEHVPHLLGTAGLATLGGGLLTLFGGEREWAKSTRMNLAAYLMLQSLMVALDEFSSPVIGANDNASGVAVLLGIAERLTVEPLDHTEVWLVFTGSEAVGGAGMDVFLQDHAKELRDARFLVLKGVGVGNLCWVSKHHTPSLGIDYFPHPDAASWTATTAQQHPELGVMEREMTTFDEVAILNQYGLKGVCLMGYDRLTGRLPHHYRYTDQHSQINPETLATAADFTWAMLQNI
jgi:hypothetical protein